MKKRHGFVSNSSSSSFTCDVCSHDESGWDMCYSEAGMFCCENDHTFCESHKVDVPKEKWDLEKTKIFLIQYYIGNKKELLYINSLESLEEMEGEYSSVISSEDDEEDDPGYVSADICPLCSLGKISDNNIKRYLYKKHSINEKETLVEIRQMCKNYDELLAFIKD